MHYLLLPGTYGRHSHSAAAGAGDRLKYAGRPGGNRLRRADGSVGSTAGGWGDDIVPLPRDGG